MSSENKFWVSIWSLFVFLVLGFFAILSYHDHITDKKIVKMVEAGASPIEARCALIQAYDDRPLCIGVLLHGSK
jgi:hypothetical protein